MTDKDEAMSIERLPELSSFKSCIEYYGKSILPPVLSSYNKEELQQMRSQAVQVESQKKKLRKKKEELFDKVQEVYQKLEEHLNSREVSPSNDLEDHENSPKSMAGASKFGKRLPLNDCDIEILDCESECSKDELQSSRPNSAFRNVLLDNAQSFCMNSEPGIYFCSPHHVVPAPASTTGNSIQQEQQSNVGLVCYTDMSSSCPESCADSENSDDLMVSESEEADCVSLATVILNTYEKLGCDLEAASIDTSTGRSSDLGKYLDLSADDSSLSITSPVVNGLEPNDSDTVVESSNDPTPVNSMWEKHTSINSTTYVIRRESNVDEIPDILESEESSQISNSAHHSTDANVIRNMNIESFPVSGRHNSSLLEIANDDNTFHSPTKPSDISDPTSVLGNEEEYKSRYRHMRRKSYTLDQPSPVLVNLHAGCKCNACPEIQVSPHSSSKEFEKLLTPPSPYASDIYKSSVSTDLQLKESGFDDHKLNIEQLPTADDSVQDQEVFCLDQSMLTKTLSERYEMVKEMHRQRVEKLLAEQHKQWLKLQAEYKEQELLLQEEFKALKLSTLSGILNCDSRNSKIDHTADVDCETLSYDPSSARIGCRDTTKTNENSARNQVRSSSADIHNSSRQEPFRRRGSTSAVTSSYEADSSNKLSVCAAVSSTNRPSDVSPKQRPQHNITRSKSCDISPCKPKNEPLPGSSKSSEGGDFPKEMPPLMVLGTQKKAVPLKPVAKQTRNRFGPLKALSPLSVAQTYVVVNEKRNKKEKAKYEAQHVFSLIKAISDPGIQKKFEKVSAAVKGYLTRRLLQTETVQNIINTMLETANLIINFESDTATKREAGTISHAENELGQRLMKQFTKGHSEIHDIFFGLSTKERMAIIAKSRQTEKERQQATKKERRASGDATMYPFRNPVLLSSATVKSLERKKLRAMYGNKSTLIECYLRKPQLNNVCLNGQKKAEFAKAMSPKSILQNSRRVAPERKSGVFNTKARNARRSLY